MVSVPNFNVGDIVELQFENNIYSKAVIPVKVMAIYTNRPVPGIDTVVIGTETNPAVKFQIYHKDEEGNLIPLDEFAAYTFRELQRILVP